VFFWNISFTFSTPFRDTNRQIHRFLRAFWLRPEPTKTLPTELASVDVMTEPLSSEESCFHRGKPGGGDRSALHNA
jgi:hypothetical protein